MMRSPWRTFFSVSGMAIGIIAVMLVFALGAGAERGDAGGFGTDGKKPLSGECRAN